jgi:ubiquinone/menaquinone biosynthesis C-methylase UbiE
MRLMHSLLRFFFKMLYHQFAWSYDLVAGLVSLGRWKEWVESVLPWLGGRVLEIGFGPGHLQVVLHRRGLAAFGLDESRQMCRLAHRRLAKKGFVPNLIRGLGQNQAFEADAFDTVVATFPAEYIFDAHTLSETSRVLKPGGKLIIVLSAWITGQGFMERLAAWLFEITGQAKAIEAALRTAQSHLQSSGFSVRNELVEFPGSRVLVIIGSKSMGLYPGKPN